MAEHKADRETETKDGTNETFCAVDSVQELESKLQHLSLVGAL